MPHNPSWFMHCESMVLSAVDLAARQGNINLVQTLSILEQVMSKLLAGTAINDTARKGKETHADKIRLWMSDAYNWAPKAKPSERTHTGPIKLEKQSRLKMRKRVIEQCLDPDNYILLEKDSGKPNWVVIERIRAYAEGRQPNVEANKLVPFTKMVEPLELVGSNSGDVPLEVRDGILGVCLLPKSEYTPNIQQVDTEYTLDKHQVYQNGLQPVGIADVFPLIEQKREEQNRVGAAPLAPHPLPVPVSPSASSGEEIGGREMGLVAAGASPGTATEHKWVSHPDLGLEWEPTGKTNGVAAGASPPLELGEQEATKKLPSDSHLEEEDEMEVMPTAAPSKASAATEPQGNVTLSRSQGKWIARAHINGRNLGFKFTSWDNFKGNISHELEDWRNTLYEHVGRMYVEQLEYARMDNTVAKIWWWYNHSWSASHVVGEKYVEKTIIQERVAALLSWDQDTQKPECIIMHFGDETGNVDKLVWELRENDNGNWIASSNKGK